MSFCRDFAVERLRRSESPGASDLDNRAFDFAPEHNR